MNLVQRCPGVFFEDLTKVLRGNVMRALADIWA
jgi:hypothetical protein